MTRTILGALLVSGMLFWPPAPPARSSPNKAPSLRKTWATSRSTRTRARSASRPTKDRPPFGGGELPEDFPIDMPEGGEVQSVIEQEDALIVSVSYDHEFSAIADHFQGWFDDNGLEVINRFGSSDPQSITWSVEDEDRAYNITLATADDMVRVTVMTGEN